MFRSIKCKNYKIAGGKGLMGHIGKGRGQPEPAPSPFVSSCTILRHLTRSQRSTNFTTGTGTVTISVTAQHLASSSSYPYLHRGALFVGVDTYTNTRLVMMIGTGTVTISVPAQHWRVYRHILIFIGMHCLPASTRILVLIL